MREKYAGIRNGKYGKKLKQYEKELVESGFARSSVRVYVSDAAQYIATGNELSIEAADKYFDAYDGCGSGRMFSYKSDVKKFIGFLNGEKVARRHYNFDPVVECDHDCFNCKYEDCVVSE